MHSVKKNIKYSIAMLIACIAALSFSCTMVFADTNGTEIKITDQPDRLIIQLGPEWIGVEFELKTDAGVFPAPVVVDDSGILRMDLGGSKTYTLSCLASSVSIPTRRRFARSDHGDNTVSDSQLHKYSYVN